MITVETASNALKTFYLDAVTQELDTKMSPFFAAIQKTTSYVTGKDVEKLVRKDNCGGIAAREEAGELPTMQAREYIKFNTPLKNIYGSIRISDKAIRASANSEGAFVNLLEDEMNALVKSAKYNFSRMLFGDGTGKLAKINYCDGEILMLDSLGAVGEGMEVDIISDTGIVDTSLVIKVVDRMNNYVIIENNNVDAEAIENNACLYIHGSRDNELTGLGAIFSENELYGVDRASTYMQPFVLEDAENISELMLQNAIDALEECHGSKVNMILCSWGVRRALMQYCRENGIGMERMKLGYEESVLSFNGIPIVADKFCPKGTMYLLNTDDFKLCQLCDWQWLEDEDGKILKQIPGLPVYTATLVKYAELICERPCGQGIITGIIEF